MVLPEPELPLADAEVQVFDDKGLAVIAFLDMLERHEGVIADHGIHANSLSRSGASRPS